MDLVRGVLIALVLVGSTVSFIDLKPHQETVAPYASER
jgi:hypothetical protein